MVHRRHDRALADDEARLQRLFGTSDLLPLWIAEPYVALSPALVAAIEERASTGWYGYETRPESVGAAFWDWMLARHSWDGAGTITSISPSVGTSLGVLIETYSEPGDGVILQPPVFTDFKPLVQAAGRTVVKNPLVLTPDGYRMDFDALVDVAARPSTRVMILCNPHNPVGRLWRPDELLTVAEIAAANDVLVIADEIHADLALRGRSWTPFGVAASGTGAVWAATHGPIKTFGLAGVCDTLLVTNDDDVAGRFRSMSNRLHLTRNNVFAVAAFDTVYREGGAWLDGFLEDVAGNAELLAAGLDGPIAFAEPEATYLAWLDFRGLDLDALVLADRLGSAGIALSPGHWFGREGAGFARMTIATSADEVRAAIAILNALTR